MSDESSEVGSLIDRRLDSHGNEWYLLHNAQRVETRLGEEDEVDRIVITPAGREYYKAYGRPRLFKDFIKGKLLEGHLPIQDGEGIFSVVWPASDKELDILMKSEEDIPPVIFIKRSRTDKETAFLLGWEKIDFFDAARPAFEKCGFGLIKPLGADKDALFLPQVEGETLRDFIRKISKRRDRQEIQARFLEDSLVLEGEVMVAVRDLVRQKGYRLEEDNGQDSHRFINPDGDEVKDLIVLIDVYPGLLKKDNPHRYKNAMVPQGVYEEIAQLLKDKDFDGAYKVLKNAIIFIDPFYIGVPKH